MARGIRGGRKGRRVEIEDDCRYKRIKCPYCKKSFIADIRKHKTGGIKK